MLLCNLLQGFECALLQGNPRTEITAVCCDSRCVVPGAVFFCLPGQTADGAHFALQAVQAGAAAVVSNHTLQGIPPAVTVIQAENPRLLMAWAAARLYGSPATKMTMVGITGTKGKTTTAAMLAAILTAAGRRVGTIGTNGIRMPGQQRALRYTTPESCDLQRMLQELVAAKCDTCIMEVSSLGLKYDRTAGIAFDVGIFTNLSPDHIGTGEHADFAEYRAWKAQLFRQCAVCVVNADDAALPYILQKATGRIVRYGLQNKTDWQAVPPFTLWQTKQALGVRFAARNREGKQRTYTLPMPGKYSVYNALAALAAADSLSVPPETAAIGLQSTVVCGRAEVVPCHAPFTVLIDYAHNEAAAENLLRSLRSYTDNRLIAVFGCGGGRSRLRRYGMGRVCAQLADLCVITEDNSRGEPTQQIMQDVRRGMRQGNPQTPFAEISNRLQALHYALDRADAGDIVAVLGKGHETTLCRGNLCLPFEERKIIQEYLQQKYPPQHGG